MKLFLLKLFVFVSITVAWLFALQTVYSRKAMNFIPSKIVKLLGMRSEKLDYMVVGSSRSHNNFDPGVVDSITGLRGYNAGYEGSGLSENYLFLSLYLSNGNLLHTCFLQVDEFLMGDPKITLAQPFHEQFFISLMNDPEVDKAYAGNVPAVKYYIWKYIPFAGYSEFNRICRPEFLFRKRPEAAEPENGYHPLSGRSALFPVKYYMRELPEMAASPESIAWLKRIKELCNAHHVQLIVYTSPYFVRSYEANRQPALKRTLDSTLVANHIPYYDFSAVFGNDSSLFYDVSHLNAQGTALFSARFAEKILATVKRKDPIGH